MVFFCMLPKDICQKYNINKIISEKDKFYELYTKIYNSELDSNEFYNIINNEFRYPDEFKSLKLSHIDYNINRWKLYGNKMLNFLKIDNEEYFYYIFQIF